MPSAVLFCCLSPCLTASLAAGNLANMCEGHGPWDS